MDDELPASAPEASGGAEAVEPSPAGGRLHGERARRANVLVDSILCKACGICVDLCPTDVFERDSAGQAVPVRPEQCTVCRLCEWHCPDFAIEVLAEEGAEDSKAPSSLAVSAAGGAEAD